MTDVREYRRNLVTLAIVLLCIAGTTGCPQGPRKYQVSGTVHYKDGSVPKGSIAVVQFQPVRDSTAEVHRSASGAINPDGSFTMNARAAGEGVYAGDYIVVFNVANNLMDPKPLVLEKYWKSTLSPFKVTVDHNMTDLNYEIEPMPGVVGGKAP